MVQEHPGAAGSHRDAQNHLLLRLDAALPKNPEVLIVQDAKEDERWRRGPPNLPCPAQRKLCGIAIMNLSVGGHCLDGIWICQPTAGGDLSVSCCKDLREEARERGGVACAGSRGTPW